MLIVPFGARRLPESRRRSVVLPAPFAGLHQQGTTREHVRSARTADEQGTAALREIERYVLETGAAILKGVR